MADSEVICPHLHVCVQAGEDGILKKMRRNYDTAYFARLMARARGKLPRAALGTDVIVGFPGETEAAFGASLDFLEDQPLTYFHVFPYSAPPGNAGGGHVRSDPPGREEGTLAPGARARHAEEARVLPERGRAPGVGAGGRAGGGRAGGPQGLQPQLSAGGSRRRRRPGSPRSPRQAPTMVPADACGGKSNADRQFRRDRKPPGRSGLPLQGSGAAQPLPHPRILRRRHGRPQRIAGVPGRRGAGPGHQRPAHAQVPGKERRRPSRACARRWSTGVCWRTRRRFLRIGEVLRVGKGEERTGGPAQGVDPGGVVRGAAGRGLLGGRVRSGKAGGGEPFHRRPGTRRPGPGRLQDPSPGGQSAPLPRSAHLPAGAGIRSEP